mgnify:CR=1 FL=1
MEDNNMTVPYIVYEGAMARFERHHRRLVIALIISIALVFISNAIWLYAWTQYDYTSEDVTVDSTDGIANYIGGSGGIVNGTNHSTP